MNPIQHEDDSPSPHVSIVLLNMNGGLDTIECLESLAALNYPSFEVIVCDNASLDDSWSRICEWGRGLSSRDGSSRLRDFVVEPICDSRPDGFRSGRVTLVQTGGNLGFAGGTNVGIRLALCDLSVCYVWLLNNDTTVEPEALSTLIARMSEDPGLGLCGSTVRYFHLPDLVQCYGGSWFNLWLSRGGGIGIGERHDAWVDRSMVERRLAYVEGASTLASRDFLEQIGLLSEDYFLYFEELDWSERAKGKFRLGFAPDSIVFHKEGATAGTAARKRPSILSLYFMTRSRCRFYRRFHPRLLPLVFMKLGYVMLKRSIKGVVVRVCWSEVRAMFRAMTESDDSAELLTARGLPAPPSRMLRSRG